MHTMMDWTVCLEERSLDNQLKTHIVMNVNDPAMKQISTALKSKH